MTLMALPTLLLRLCGEMLLLVLGISVVRSANRGAGLLVGASGLLLMLTTVFSVVLDAVSFGGMMYAVSSAVGGSTSPDWLAYASMLLFLSPMLAPIGQLVAYLLLAMGLFILARELSARAGTWYEQPEVAE